jgi:hypothetical protein
MNSSPLPAVDRAADFDTRLSSTKRPASLLIDARAIDVCGERKKRVSSRFR